MWLQEGSQPHSKNRLEFADPQQPIECPHSKGRRARIAAAPWTRFPVSSVLRKNFPVVVGKSRAAHSLGPLPCSAAGHRTKQRSAPDHRSPAAAGARSAAAGPGIARPEQPRTSRRCAGGNPRKPNSAASFQQRSFRRWMHKLQSPSRNRKTARGSATQ